MGGGVGRGVGDGSGAYGPPPVKGAFADVYLSEHIYLNSQVAIKVLHTQVDAHATEDFLTEARHLSHLPQHCRVDDPSPAQGDPNRGRITSC